MRAFGLVLLALALAGAAAGTPPEIPDRVPYSAVVPGGGAGLVRLRDVNDDGDFADVGDSVVLLSPTTAVDAVEIGSDAWVATERNAYFAP